VDSNNTYPVYKRSTPLPPFSFKLSTERLAVLLKRNIINRTIAFKNSRLRWHVCREFNAHRQMQSSPSGDYFWLRGSLKGEIVK